MRQLRSHCRVSGQTAPQCLKNIGAIRLGSALEPQNGLIWVWMSLAKLLLAVLSSSLLSELALGGGDGERGPFEVMPVPAVTAP